MCTPCLSLDICPDLLQNPPGASQHLLIYRFKQQQRAVSGDKELFSAPMPGISSLFPSGKLAGVHLPSCSSGIQSKISAGSCARLSFSLAGLLDVPAKKNRVNLADSKSLHKLMYELEEWKNELWLMMIFFFFFDLNKSLLKHFSSVQLLLVQSCLC